MGGGRDSLSNFRDDCLLTAGEVNIGRRRVKRLHGILKNMPPFPDQSEHDRINPPSALFERHRHLFELGQSINGFKPVGGNTGRLLADSNATISALVADIDAAVDHVHLLFYIWLPDHNGLKVVEALIRASKRGVTCRAMADALGSASMIASTHWIPCAWLAYGSQQVSLLEIRYCVPCMAAST